MKIGIDLDDVLIEFLPSLIQYHNEAHSTCLELSQFTSYKFWEIWGGTREQAVQKVYAFHKTPHFQNIPAVIGAQEAVRYLSANHDLYVITSRQQDIMDETKKSIHRHFGDHFSGIFFANHYANSGHEITKRQICEDLGIDVMIEDSADYAQDCLDEYRRIFLFDKPWNRERVISPKISRVYSWQEILQSL